MQKRMSLFLSYIKIFVPTTVISIFLLRWYAMEFLYRTPEKYWPGMPTTLAATVLIALIVIVIIYRLSQPFDSVIKRIQNGEDPSDEERSRALSVYTKTNYVTLVANVVGFFIGQIGVLIIEVSSGVTEYHLPRLIFSVIQAVLVGATSAIATIFIFNEMLAPQRQLLKIRAIEGFEEHRTMSVSKTILTIFVISLLSMCINTTSVSFEIINRQMTNPVNNALSIYLQSSVLVFFASFIPSFLVLLVILFGLRKRIQVTSNLVKGMGEKGDLNSRIDITMLDDFGDLTGSINLFMNQLSTMIVKLKDETEVVSHSASVLSAVSDTASEALYNMNDTLQRIESESKQQNELISTVNEDVSDLSSKVKNVEQHMLNQTSALQQSSASIAEMAANISSVATMTKKADDLSTVLTTTSLTGNESLQQAVNAVTEIQSASIEVQEIVQVIQKIASQTNLLSMNAAIEAAHAGAAGRGFAIVADEVRSLAASSGKSAKDIQNHIKDMVTKINGGVQSIKEAGTAFQIIASNVQENSQLIQTIANAMEEQKLGADETLQATNEVVNAITAIKDLTAKQSKSAENVQKAMLTVVESAQKVAQAVQESSENSVNLKESISKVEETVINNSEAVVDMKTHIDIFHV